MGSIGARQAFVVVEQLAPGLLAEPQGLERLVAENMLDVVPNPRREVGGGAALNGSRRQPEGLGRLDISRAMTG